jgi:parallel beta-helix repeat protein
MSASAATLVPPSRARGSARTSVRDHGARGDGVHDDSAAFQRAIDAQPDDGGTVEVPAGTYLIDPTRRTSLRSRMHLELAPEAQLKAKPNAEQRAYVLMAALVSDIEISGGRILGDRDTHHGSTGEWGHGIALYGASRVTVRDILVSRCWGDGIGIGGKRPGGKKKLAPVPSQDIVLSGVTCTGNRRQGLTIGHSRDVRVHDCEFSDTAGTLPQCGIDIEPDAPGTAVRAHIENCVVRGNRGSGIQIHKRSSDITVKGCTIENNGGYGVLAVGTMDGLIVDNLIRGNGLQGIGLRGGTRNYQASRNDLSGNRLRQRGPPGAGKETD